LPGQRGSGGEMGPTGDTGSSGLIGPGGDPGVKGVQGGTGLAGPEGSTGASGVAGEVGTTGPRGATGKSTSSFLPLFVLEWKMRKLFDGKWHRFYGAGCLSYHLTDNVKTLAAWRSG